MTRSIRSTLALAFIVTGIAVLAGAQTPLALFDQIGLGQWLRYLTGFAAVSGGLLLFMPSRAVLGSAIATVISLGALLVQSFMAVGSPVLMAILAFLSGGSLVQAQLDQPVTIRRRPGHAA